MMYTELANKEAVRFYLHPSGTRFDVIHYIWNVDSHLSPSNDTGSINSRRRYWPPRNASRCPFKTSKYIIKTLFLHVLSQPAFRLSTVNVQSLIRGVSQNK